MKEFSFNNKNVVLLIKVAELGGAERQALGLAKYLISQYNCKVSLVATHSNLPTEEFKNFAKECGIEKVEYFGTPSLTIRKNITITNFKKTIRALHYLYKIKVGISKLKPNILIPFLNTPSKIAALIYKSTGAEYTFWHQLGLDTYMFDVLEKKAIQKVPFIIANAENGLDVFIKEYKVPKEKLFVLPQYVSINKVNLNKEKLRAKFNIRKEAIIIGMIAHYRDEKYQELLLNAFSEINTLNEVHLVLLGNKDNDENTLLKYNYLIKLAKSKEIELKVSVLSGYPVEKVLNILDIGVLVSETEGTPNVVMEYMLYGIPTIASNHIGCKRLLGASNYLIKNDKNLLTKKLEELISDKELRIKVGKTNMERIKKHDIKNYVNSLTDILNVMK